MNGESDRRESRVVGTTFPPHGKIRLDKISGFFGEFETARGNRRETVVSRSDFIRAAQTGGILLEIVDNARMYQESEILIRRCVYRRDKLKIESHRTVGFDDESHRKTNDEIIGNRRGYAVAACNNRNDDADVTTETRLLSFRLLLDFRLLPFCVFRYRIVPLFPDCLWFIGVLRNSLCRQICCHQAGCNKQKQAADE